MNERKPIGEITHYFGGIEVAVVKFNKKMKAGDKVCFKGATTDFEQKLDSMQLDHKEVKEAAKGKEVGIKVSDKVRAGDKVYEV
ncbi:MAG: translation elongation factor-like protein [Candidatus Colwellbacteria bacterium CG10_big_fil_rev_8_21_14_0_10_42_22]|uniref:Translation elongation factor-like protein n=1 Tax=Candidatus Colwellbacteria bacterium CG10_big_fil_rev_8_21_14_0_10_42_22 TaxID=1974540 RepID=A0A2H0VFS9_9BACT|nr:MAG: translation elongation factor-like protein [Candidatus Colwellbacteria bacterium CG10_big_fil_rev_8_21_14_0_10_42_22]